MTMHPCHSPKPKMFGEGYGTHLAYNYRLVKMFFKLGAQVLINAIVPGVYYEQAHWGVIDLYHKMSGYRHGTFSDHRCSECGGDLPSRDEIFDQRNNERKELLVLKEENEELKRHICAIVITPEVEKRIKEIESGEVEGIDWRDLDEQRVGEIENGHDKPLGLKGLENK